MLLARRFPMMLDFERTLDEMNRVFDMFDAPLGLRSMPRGTFPAVNLYDNETELLLTAEIPGVKIDDIGLSVTENTITLTGKRNGVQENKKGRWYRQERVMGQFERTITLAEKVDSAKATAEYKDGILTVHLPKVKVTAPKSIEVKTK